MNKLKKFLSLFITGIFMVESLPLHTFAGSECGSNNQPTYALPLIYDYFTEIVYPSGAKVADAKAKFSFNVGVQGESHTTVENGTSVVSDMKYSKRIPTYVHDKDVNITADGKSCTIVRKIVDISRKCEKDRIRIIVNTKFIVRCK